MWIKEFAKRVTIGKYKEREISYEERKKLQLDILRDVDRFCRLNKIKYCLGYGTMLGAVRHNGYIPWDDDIDLLMPLTDMMRFKNEYKSDIYMYADIDSYKHFDFSFSRIIDTRTFSIRGPRYKFYGVNIDLYPVLGLPGTNEEIGCFMNELKQKLEKKLAYHNFQNKFNSRAPFCIYPLDKPLRKYRDFIFKYSYDKSEQFFCAGWPFIDQIFDVDYFENLIDWSFEGELFLIPALYDRYLKQRYGDYMQLPPENERVAHHNRFCFWK